MALFRSDFQGSIYGTEVFQHGFSWSSSDTAVGLAGDLATAWAAFLNTTDVALTWRTDVIWSQVNVSELGATPADPIVTSSQAAIGEAGTATTDGLPPQVAPCVSLRTVTAGSRARGRSYLPSPTVTSVTSAGRLETAVVTDLMDGLDAFFAAMAGQGASCSVISAVGGVWTARPVVTIAMGDVLDTQRSRRSAIAEVYQTRAV